MEVANSTQLVAADSRLVDHIVGELKSQGIFDQFRKECIADVDTKPAYQNLRQRVEGNVSNFLSMQKWKSDLNKNQIREMLRKNIQESGFLETGVERIVDQVVNPKINSTFFPQVEEVFYKFIGMEKPDKSKNKEKSKTETITVNTTTSSDLPTDLDPISPASDKSQSRIREMMKETYNDEEKPSTLSVRPSTPLIDEATNDSEKMDDSFKLDDEESPPFEPIEEASLEENTNDSHISMDEIKHEIKEEIKMEVEDQVDAGNKEPVNMELSSADSSDDVFVKENNGSYTISNENSLSNDIQINGNIEKVEEKKPEEKKESESRSRDRDRKKDKSDHNRSRDHKSSSSKSEKDRKRDSSRKDSHRDRKDSEKKKDDKEKKPKEDDKKTKEDDKKPKEDDKKLKEDDKKPKEDDKKKDDRHKHRSSSSHDKKERTGDKEKSTKHSSSKHDSHHERKSSSVKDDKSKSKSSTSRDKHNSDRKHREEDKKDNPKKESVADKAKDKKKDDKYKSSSRHSSSKSSSKKDKDSKNGKKKDDHSSSREKHGDSRRSTDRDSNDGNYSSSVGNSQNTDTKNLSGNLSQRNQPSGGGSSTGENTSDSATDQIENVVINPEVKEDPPNEVIEEPIEEENIHQDKTQKSPVKVDVSPTSEITLNGIVQSPKKRTVEDLDMHHGQFSTQILDGQIQVKLKKPKIASNIFEARRLMKIRKRLEKLERKRQKQLNEGLNNHRSSPDSISLDSLQNGVSSNDEDVEMSECSVLLDAAIVGRRLASNDENIDEEKKSKMESKTEKPSENVDSEKNESRVVAKIEEEESRITVEKVDEEKKSKNELIVEKSMEKNEQEKKLKRGSRTPTEKPSEKFDEEKKSKKETKSPLEKTSEKIEEEKKSKKDIRTLVNKSSEKTDEKILKREPGSEDDQNTPLSKRLKKNRIHNLQRKRQEKLDDVKLPEKTRKTDPNIDYSDNEDDCLYFSSEIEPVVKRFLREVAAFKKRGVQIDQRVDEDDDSSANGDETELTPPAPLQRQTRGGVSKAITAPILRKMQRNTNTRGVKRKANAENELPENNKKESAIESSSSRTAVATSVDHPKLAKKTNRPTNKRTSVIVNEQSTQNFVLPLSPESDSTTCVSPLEIAKNNKETIKGRVQGARASKAAGQRYTSDDLYKPRPVIGTTRRSRAIHNQTL